MQIELVWYAGRVTNITSPTLRVLNLGGGVQSSVMALMADRGLLGPIPDVAIHADTQSDPPHVLQMVDWLRGVVSYPVEVVTKGNIETDLLRGENSTGQTFMTIPQFSINPDGTKGQGRRQCTQEYKIRPIRRRVRERLGVAPGYPVPRHLSVEYWFGMSLDELSRVKPAREHYATNRYPLIEADMTRWDCQRWWQTNAPDGAPELGRSACFFCPYQSSREWAGLADRYPDLLDRAERLEEAMNTGKAAEPGFSYFLHRRCVPLREALTADRAADRAQPALFDAECEGYCGI